MKTTYSILTSVILFITLFYGCSNDDFEPIPGVCPVVVSTNPEDGAIGVPLEQIITVLFNEEMNPETFTQSSFLLKGAGTDLISGEVSLSGALATFSPTNPLIANTTYTGTVTTAVKDRKGNALQEDYLFTFTTGLTLIPTVISTDPLNLATNVFLNKTVSADFNMLMDPTTINASTFTLKRGTTVVAGEVVYLDQSAYFNPSEDLVSGTEYTATITTGAKNTFGTPIATNYTWKFTTGTTIAPKIISTDPINNASGVALDKTISAIFSMVMDPTTINTSTFTLKQGTTAIVGTVTYSGLTAFFNPSTDLLYGKEYTATINTGAKNVPGIPLVGNYTWKFTAGATVAPKVISTDPNDNATDVVIDKTLTAIFNVAMDPATINTNTFKLKQGTTVIPGTVTYSGRTAYFNPDNDLLVGTTYTATVTNGAKDVQGTPMENNYTWKFTTGTIIAPRVVSTDPLDNATGVALDKTVAAVFSVVMDPTTINTSTFTLKQGATVIPGAVTYSGQTAYFNPTSNLVNGLEYTAKITTGAKNTEGTAMTSNYTWQFTTVGGVAPKVISTDPLNNATGVSLNKTLAAVFSMNMDPATINTSTFTLKQGANTVAGAVTYSGVTASFNPDSNLLSGIEYTATITTGAKSTTGVPLASNYTWKFTTVTAVVPTVIATDPINNAIGVALNKNVTADFSIAMDPTTINNTSVLLKKGTTVIPGFVTYSGVRLTFNPTVNFEENTTYTATITTDAKSTGGIPLASNYVWSFKTLATPVPTVNLNSVARFGIFAGVGVSNNAGFSEIRNLDVGITPGVRSSVTGFPPAIVVNGAIYCSDDITPPGTPAMLTQAKTDLLAAYLYAEGATTPAPATVSGDQGGLTLYPGIYKSTSTLLIQNGDLTLDAQGDPNATWIFQVASGFTTVGGAGGNVILAGGAKAKNVFWQTGSSATIGDYTIFKGNILALTSITMNSNATVEGRMLCLNGAIVMTNTNIISKPAN